VPALAVIRPILRQINLKGHRRLNVSGRTVRRHRKEAADHGLIEVLGHGQDRKPCIVFQLSDVAVADAHRPSAAHRFAANRTTCFFLAGGFACCAALAVPGRAYAQEPVGIPKFSPASVKAAPDLRCTLHPPGSPSTGIPVFTDADGYARFHAVRPNAGSAGETLALSCTDPAGGTVS
jgi:hypothetical protein